MSCCYCLPRIWCLTEQEQLFLRGCTTQTVKPEVAGTGGMFCIGPFYSGHRRSGISLTKTEYLKIRNTITGEIKIQRGPCLFFFGAYDEEAKAEQAISLSPTEFLRVTDEMSGEMRIEKGPQLWFPNPYDIFNMKESAVALRHNQYVKILETRSGNIRVEIGEQLVFLSATEQILDPGTTNGVKNAVHIDEHTAILVRNTETGQLRLERSKGLFFPKAKEEIEEVRKKIVLEENQVAIMKTRDGRYLFKGGKAADDDDPELKEYSSKVEDDKDNSKQAFFVPPFCELVKLEWFKGDGVAATTTVVSLFDLRPQFLKYDFVCRSCDNVELQLHLNCFWQISDIRKMIQRTADLPTAICVHARSSIVGAVSRLTFEKFLANFNSIVTQAVLDPNDTFYSDRGAILHTAEVTGLHCVDEAVEAVLREIIKETTNRLNRLQHQASENEVRLTRLRGEIEAEKMNGQLLRLRKDHQKVESKIEGGIQADRIVAMMKGLDEANVPSNVQVQMWETLQKAKSIKDVSQGGNSTLYFTPSDVNLSIESMGGPQTKAMKK